MYFLKESKGSLIISALTFIVLGLVPVSYTHLPLITHRFHYTEFEKGFEAMNSGKSGKVILSWED